MNISLDYDGTFSADPELWTAFVKVAQERGHTVYCVTKREPRLGTPGLNIPTIFTSRKGKYPIVQAQGIGINIWIDDEPLGIYANDGQCVQIG